VAANALPDTRELATHYANRFRFVLEAQLPVDQTVALISEFMTHPATVRHAATRQFSEWTQSEVFMPRTDGIGYEFLNVKSPRIQASATQIDQTGQYQVVNLILQTLRHKSEADILTLMPSIEQFLNGVHPNEFTSRYDTDGDLPHHSICKYLLPESNFSIHTAANLLRIFYERRATYGGINLFGQTVNDGSDRTMVNILLDSSEDFASTRGLRAGVLRAVLENIGIDNARILLRESGFSEIGHIAELPAGPIKQVLDGAISNLFQPA